ncbi:MAG: sensor histidine kinase [Chloroflexota bacterium]|nr:sensor histidine kinase [Chloroflexota bacterium]
MSGIRRAWERAPILEKVLIGNALVIIVGAIGGTFITNALVDVSGIALALFFATVGITLSLLINSYLLQSALRPMDVLQRTVEDIDRGDTAVRAPVDEIGDPQLKNFAHALNTMLERLAAHTRMIEASRAQVRRLSGQVLNAQEDERKRIARELHDDTSGSLARVLLNIEMLEDALPEQGLPEVRAKIRDTRVLAEQTLENVRKMIFGLRPTLLDDLGLAAAVRWYAKNSLEPTGIQVQFEASSNLGRASATIETALFRIAQEAITNIIRHADARHVRVQLTRAQSKVLLLVQDDGRGFDVSVKRESDGDHRWGLFGVEERVQLLGGAFGIESGEGKGTTLRVEIPVE